MHAQICGNVAARAVVVAKQKGARMVSAGGADAEAGGFVSEEDAAQALLML